MKKAWTQKSQMVRILEGQCCLIADTAAQPYAPTVLKDLRLVRADREVERESSISYQVDADRRQRVARLVAEKKTVSARIGLAYREHASVLFKLNQERGMHMKALRKQFRLRDRDAEKRRAWEKATAKVASRNAWRLTVSGQLQLTAARELTMHLRRKPTWADYQQWCRLQFKPKVETTGHLTKFVPKPEIQSKYVWVRVKDPALFGAPGTKIRKDRKTGIRAYYRKERISWRNYPPSWFLRDWRIRRARLVRQLSLVRYPALKMPSTAPTYRYSIDEALRSIAALERNEEERAKAHAKFKENITRLFSEKDRLRKAIQEARRAPRDQYWQCVQSQPIAAIEPFGSDRMKVPWSYMPGIGFDPTQPENLWFDGTACIPPYQVWDRPSSTKWVARIDDDNRASRLFELQAQRWWENPVARAELASLVRESHWYVSGQDYTGVYSYAAALMSGISYSSDGEISSYGSAASVPATPDFDALASMSRRTVGYVQIPTWFDSVHILDEDAAVSPKEMQRAYYRLRALSLKEVNNFNWLRSAFELKDTSQTVESGRELLQLIRWCRTNPRVVPVLTSRGLAWCEAGSLQRLKNVAGAPRILKIGSEVPLLSKLKLPLRAVINAYLAWKFAVQPTISDINTVASDTEAAITMANRDLGNIVVDLVNAGTKPVTLEAAIQYPNRLRLPPTKVGKEQQAIRTIGILRDNTISRPTAKVVDAEFKCSLRDISFLCYSDNVGALEREPYVSWLDATDGDAQYRLWFLADTTGTITLPFRLTHIGSLRQVSIQEVPAQILRLFGELWSRDCQSRCKDEVGPGVEVLQFLGDHYQLTAVRRGKIFAAFQPRDLLDMVADPSFAEKFASARAAEVGWELMPLSFVLDWFTDIGANIRTIQNRLTASAIRATPVSETWFTDRIEAYYGREISLDLSTPALREAEGPSVRMSFVASDEKQGLLTQEIYGQYSTVVCMYYPRQFKLRFTLSRPPSTHVVWKSAAVKAFCRYPVELLGLEDYVPLPSLQVHMTADKLHTLLLMLGSSKLK